MFHQTSFFVILLIERPLVAELHIVTRLMLETVHQYSVITAYKY